jgi:hypothetical protein
VGKGEIKNEDIEMQSSLVGKKRNHLEGKLTMEVAWDER